MLSMGRRHTCAEDIFTVKWKLCGQTRQTGETKKCNWTCLRPDHSLEDGITLIWAKVVPVEIIKEILDPEDAESPQVL